MKFGFQKFKAQHTLINNTNTKIPRLSKTLGEED